MTAIAFLGTGRRRRHPYQDAARDRAGRPAVLREPRRRPRRRDRRATCRRRALRRLRRGAREPRDRGGAHRASSRGPPRVDATRARGGQARDRREAAVSRAPRTSIRWPPPRTRRTGRCWSPRTTSTSRSRPCSGRSCRAARSASVRFIHLNALKAQATGRLARRSVAGRRRRAVRGWHSLGQPAGEHRPDAGAHSRGPARVRCMRTIATRRSPWSMRKGRWRRCTTRGTSAAPSTACASRRSTGRRERVLFRDQRPSRDRHGAPQAALAARVDRSGRISRYDDGLPAEHPGEPRARVRSRARPARRAPDRGGIRGRRRSTMIISHLLIALTLGFVRRPPRVDLGHVQGRAARGVLVGPLFQKRMGRRRDGGHRIRGRQARPLDVPARGSCSSASSTCSSAARSSSGRRFSGTRTRASTSSRCSSPCSAGSCTGGANGWASGW